MGFLPLALLAAVSQEPPAGQQTFTSSGTFTVPQGVKSVSVVCVGGGGGGTLGFNGTTTAGGGGAALAYAESIAVTPGQTFSVVVGAGASNAAGNDTYFGSTGLLLAPGGDKTGTSALGSGSAYSGGGRGGSGDLALNVEDGAGGGAGGYSGAGGRGGYPSGITPSGTDGSGGGGAGGEIPLQSGTGAEGSGGGGVGLRGEGASGEWPYEGGSGGEDGSVPGKPFMNGGLFGGGAGGEGDDQELGTGGDGGVRIIWGENRFYPSTNTGDV